LSPVSRTGVRPRRRGHRLRAGLLDRVRHGHHPARPAVPADDDGRTALPLGLVGGPGDLGRQGVVEAPHGHLAALHAGAYTAPGDVLEVLDARQRAEPFLGPGRDRAGHRVLGGVLDGAREPQQLLLVGALGGVHLVQGHAAGGDRAGLVQDDRVDAPRGLQHLRALDEDAELGAAPGADQQRGRRGEAQGARAGDDQDGDGRGERGDRVTARAEPAAEGGDRDQQDHGHEDTGDPVGQPLHLGLAALRVLHQLRRPRQLRVRADPGRLDHQPAPGVHRGAGDGVADGDVHRHGLAGQQGGVHRRGALGHRAVGGDLLAGPYDEPVAHGQPGHRYPHLASVP
jgi:hypothetical protein